MSIAMESRMHQHHHHQPDDSHHHESAIYSTPTCVQLGIPISDCPTSNVYPLREHGNNTESSSVPLALPSYLDPRYHNTFMGHYGSYVPLPNPFGFYDLEPSFIRRRNERERERVRNVNEGYARLRDHLPVDNPEKRLSKVETLRHAITYIKDLQETLHTHADEHKENCDELERAFQQEVEK